ncbi:hypothetical protein C1646_748812 [Rhizophagus diaphanus]|nr:hypothetical protein C1646_748812 [Rhizophagus diaphanus] [Rhizophagus sp. MUCL 43196]
MFVVLKSLNNLKNITIEIENENYYKPYGITRDPETKNYIIILNYKCKMCNSICNTIHFRHKFMDWTSGNDDIDKFIQDNQLSEHIYYGINSIYINNALEWIPYDRLYIAKDEFGKIYQANWIDGEIEYWDNGNWKRYNQNMFVVLKRLNNLKNITTEIENEV